MERVGIATETIHGDKIQKERNQIMKQFSDGTIHVLIATDISARGVDIPNIDFVINYDLPDEVENYVHRIGRTGRGTQRGTSISFCSSSEKEMLQNIETFISKPISVLEIDKSTYKQTILESSEFRLPIKELLQEIDEIEIRKKKKKKK